ncbi:MAG: hypothetical protein HY554_02825 [Elusimicrobia bacterium]|nr:hypothetical protein [Elusimicrobiota bacterium]
MGEWAGVAAEARRVLAGNRRTGVSGWDGRRYDFVCPSPTHYPFQWLWDSAFHAIALLHVDPELSKRELRCLLQGLQPDGFMPHMILWEKDAHPKALAEYLIRMAHPYFTATTQPPVLARAVERVYEATGDLAFVREALPQALRLFRWLREHRDPDGDGLIAIIQPDESGLDASPKFDRLMRIVARPHSETAPSLVRGMRRLFEAYGDGRNHRALCALDAFVWEDVMVNAIYADGLGCLARLARAAGRPAPEADALDAEAGRVLASLLAKCWDERAGAFWDLAGASEERERVLTFSSLFPLILPGLEPGVARRLIDDHLLNPREFWLDFPIPSVAATEPAFEADYRSRAIWRGPSWLNVNWYLYHGLRAHGRPEAASTLARRTFEMVRRGGIREFFNPRTAEGYGAVDFGWTCLVLDLLAAEGELVPDTP